MGRIAYIFKGFRVGLLLQIGGIGPICALLFQLPHFLSLETTLLGVLGVTLADGIYITLAAVGIAPLIQKIKATDKFFKILSGVFLILLGGFFISMAKSEPEFMTVVGWLRSNIFLGMFILTMMNPATIIVFTGIFTTELLNHKMGAKELFLFAFGTLLTTPLFLGTVVYVGSLGKNFFSDSTIKMLNVGVGVMLIYWGLTQFIPKLKFAKTKVKQGS